MNEPIVTEWTESELVFTVGAGYRVRFFADLLWADDLQVWCSDPTGTTVTALVKRSVVAAWLAGEDHPPERPIEVGDKVKYGEGSYEFEVVYVSERDEAVITDEKGTPYVRLLSSLRRVGDVPEENP
jgi:hypothetical protein